MKLTATYFAQCISGEHVYEVVSGSELETTCKQRLTEGRLDAIILGPGECPDCIEDAREHERRNLRMCGDFGCPFEPLFSDDPDACDDGCLAAKSLRDIKDSPYDSQLRGVTPVLGIENHVAGVTFNGRPLYTP